MYGIAFDMGTTTVGAALVERSSGKICSVRNEREDAGRFGSDVMSRLTVALRGEESCLKIRDTLLSQMNALIRKLCETAGIGTEEVSAVTVVGNTVMMHLTLGFSPETLGKAPFCSGYEGMFESTAGAFGLTSIREDAVVWGLPVIKEHVGADALSGMIHLGMDYKQEPILLVDIGTNGEAALCRDGEVFVCSTAAGPVFEGAGIRGGRVAGAGVITHVTLADGRMCLQLYDGEEERLVRTGSPLPGVDSLSEDGEAPGEKVSSPVRGICGSGVVDAAAVFLDAGLVSPEGRIYDGEELKANGVEYALGRHVVTTPAGSEIVLHAANEKVLAAAKGNPALFMSMREADREYVAIDQRSIRNFQLGKSAVRAGIEILLETANVRPEELHRMYLAGSFGDVLRIPSAVRLGLLPSVPQNRIRPVGNTALKGAVQALCSEEIRLRFETLAERAKHISLANHPAFEKYFIANMNFPETFQG